VKLLPYDAGQGPRAGVLVDNHVVDASTLLASAIPLADVRALLESSESALDRLREAIQGGGAAPLSLNAVRLRAPILQPPTVRDHIAFEEHATGQWTRESSGPRMEVWARLPIFYFSNPLCIIGPDEVVPCPAATRQLDYECELAVIVSRAGCNILEAEADAHPTTAVALSTYSARCA
jgi:fumarylacetoacetate (FAA) hydrolase